MFNRKDWWCKNNPGNSSATKVGEHIPSDFSISTISSFKSIENQHDVYKGKDCKKMSCEYLREQAKKMISFKKKKLSYQQKSCGNNMEMQKSVIFVNKNLKANMWKIKNIGKVEIIAIIQVNIGGLHIAYVISNAIYLKELL